METPQIKNVWQNVLKIFSGIWYPENVSALVQQDIMAIQQLFNARHVAQEFTFLILKLLYAPQLVQTANSVKQYQWNACHSVLQVNLGTLKQENVWVPAPKKVMDIQEHSYALIAVQESFLQMAALQCAFQNVQLEFP